jgi:hypothetical protein
LASYAPKECPLVTEEILEPEASLSRTGGAAVKGVMEEDLDLEEAALGADSVK